MGAVLGGGGAALAFALSTMCSARSSRVIGPSSALAWVALLGLVITVPFAATSSVPSAISLQTALWLLASGAGNALGLLFAYRGLRTGKVGVVGPILSAEGAVAALVALAAGQPLGAAAAAALAVVVLGVVLAGIARSTDAVPRGLSAGVPYAIAAAGCFGLSLYATGEAGAVLPLAWALLPPRLVGTVAIALPLAATGRLRVTRETVPLVVGAAACEVAGFALYTLGARTNIAIAAVLVSLFGAVAAVLGRLVFHERLARVQLLGVTTIVLGVTALSAVGH